MAARASFRSQYYDSSSALSDNKRRGMAATGIDERIFGCPNFGEEFSLRKRASETQLFHPQSFASLKTDLADFQSC